MSTLPHRMQYTYAEYLAFEASANTRHEFLDGQIYAMAGGTLQHGVMSAAVLSALFGQLQGRCRVTGSDVRVRTASGLTTYPDVTVICGASQHDAEDRLAVTNPTLLVEVLSPSTESYDRGDKFEHYKTISSLRQYVLVSHREHVIEVWTRDADHWSSATYRDDDIAELAIAARLDVSAIYAAAEATD
jgi:Uma2 family endonuclease